MSAELDFICPEPRRTGWPGSLFSVSSRDVVCSYGYLFVMLDFEAKSLILRMSLGLGVEVFSFSFFECKYF